MSFDGVDDAVMVPASGFLDLGTGGGMSIEFWIKPASLTGNQPVLEWNSGADLGVVIWHSFSSPGSVLISVSSIGSPSGYVHVESLLQLDQWQHVVFTYDKSTQVGKIFYNGGEVRSKPMGFLRAQTTYDLYLGVRAGGPLAGARMEGALDEVTLYSRALSTEEIAALHAAGETGKCFNSPPFIASQPQSQTVAEGANVSFSVSALSVGPTSYQWSFEGILIEGETADTLQVLGAQAPDQGDYQVQIENEHGSVLSDPATLTVTEQPGCVPVVPEVVAWWPFEGNGADQVGNAPGILSGSPAFVGGKVGGGLGFDGVDDQVRVPASPLLDVGAGQGMAIECWINPSSLSGNRPVLEWNNGSMLGLVMWHSYSSPGSLLISVNTIGTPTSYVHVESLLQAGQWQHIVFTYDKNSQVGVIYYNGVAVQSKDMGFLRAQTTYDLYLGVRPGGPLAGARFEGVLDEVTLYSRALSASEVASSHGAGFQGKCFDSAPIIASQPRSLTVQEGANAPFSVEVLSSVPVSYQWSFDGVPLDGATEASLHVLDVQGDDEGDYSVVVSNEYGTVVSDIATLTVSPRLPCAPLAPGLVALWPLNGNVVDEVGGQNGILVGGTVFSPGKVGACLTFDGEDDQVMVPASPALDLGAGAAMSIEFWIRPAELRGDQPIMEWNSGSELGLVVWHSYSSEGSLLFSVNSTAGGSGYVHVDSLLIEGLWQHVVFTYDQAEEVGKIYHNGAEVVSKSMGHLRAQTTYDLYLGVRAGGPLVGARMRGDLDEVALYARALTAEEVEAAFASGAGGKCIDEAPVITSQPHGVIVIEGGPASFGVTAVGVAPLGYQWLFDGFELPGETGSTLHLTGVRPESAGEYSVVVSNGNGSVTSDAATLTVLPVIEPSIVSQPQSVSVVEGGATIFEVGTTGTEPLSFQWFLGGQQLPGENSPTLALFAVGFGDEGAYAVEVSNQAGSVISAPAVLEVEPLPASIASAPMSQTVVAGSRVELKVVAHGTAPLSFRWFHDGVELEGHTVAVLELMDVQLAQAGQYSVEVSTLLGAATSPAATLTVLPAPPCPAVPAETVAWWSFEGDVNDQFGASPGIPSGSPAFVSGEVGTGLSFDGVDDQVRISASPSLDLGAGTGFSIEFWINPTSLSGNRPVLEWNDGANLGLVIWHSFSSPGSLLMSVTGVGTPSAFVHAESMLQPDQWQHVVFAYDRSNETGSIFYEGEEVARKQMGSIRAQTTYDLYLGTRAGGPLAGARLEGALDEVTLYSRALSASEIAAFHAAGPAGKCLNSAPLISSQPQSKTVFEGQDVTFNVGALGTSPSTFQWLFNGLRVEGATEQSLGVLNAQLSDGGNYQVVVSNENGSVVSETAILVVESVVPVAISSEPGSLSVTEGSSGALSVTVLGSSPLTYQWYFEGEVLSGETGPLLRFPSVRLDQAGAYWVVVENVGGAVTSEVAVVTVQAGPPLILLPPSSRSVGEGSNVMFRVLAAGAGPLSYRWFFEGQELAGKTNSSLSLTGVQTSDSGDYVVEVANAAGAVTSPGAHLVVLSISQQAPMIVQGPESQVVVEGLDATFAVVAMGTPPLTYQWYKEGVALTGETFESLVLAAVNEDSAGDYAVMVSNAFGSLSTSNASLTVDPGPSVTTRPAGEVVLVGGEAEFSVVAAGREPLVYQWFFAGTPIPGATASILQLSGVRLDQAGEYRVEVSNAFASILSVGATLVVNETQGGGGTVNFSNLGSGAVLDVDGVTQLPAGTAFIAQLYGGPSASSLVPVGSSVGFIVPGWFVGGTRVLPNVEPGRTAVVQVRVWESAFGASYEAASSNGGKSGVSANLHVLTGGFGVPPPPPARLVMASFALVPPVAPAPPVITSQPGSRTILSGETVTLAVAATDTEAYTWLLDGVQIPGATQSSLTLEGAMLVDAGDYTAVVSNRGGVVQSETARLDVVVQRVLGVVGPEATVAGAVLTVPIRLESEGAVAGGAFILRYNADLLTLPDASWGSALTGGFADFNTTGLGELRFAFALPTTTIPAGLQTVVEVAFRVRSVTEDSASILDLELVELSSATGDPLLLGTEVVSGSVVIEDGQLAGDNNGDGVLDLGDATLLQRLLTGQDSVRPWDIAANDLNANGVLDPGDSIMLLQAVSESESQPAGEGGGGTGGGSMEMCVLTPGSLRGGAGESVTVQVRLENISTRISAARFTLHYPVAALRLANAQSHRTGPMVPANALAVWNVAPSFNDYSNQSGTVTLAVSGATPWAANQGVIAELTFEVQPGGADQLRWPLNLSGQEVTEDGFFIRSIGATRAIFFGRAPIPPILAQTAWSEAGGIEFRLVGDAGASHRIQASTNLIDWATIMEIHDSPATIQVVDPGAVGLSHRFYRVLSDE